MIFGWIEISGDYYLLIVNNEFIFYILMFRVLLFLVIICIYILDWDREEFYIVFVILLNEWSKFCKFKFGGKYMLFIMSFINYYIRKIGFS